MSNVAYAQRLTDINLSNAVNRGHYLNRGRVAWWFAVPGVYGNTRQVRDLMGVNHGVLTNMASNTASGWMLTTRPGGFGHIAFDGVDDVIDCGLGAALNIAGASLSWSAWVNIQSSQGGAPVILHGKESGSAPAGGWIVYLSGNGVNFRIRDASNGNASTFTAITLTVGVWYHLAGTYDGANIRLYVNGLADGSPTSSSLSIGATNINFGIGCDTAGAGTHANMLFDDGAVWARALAAGEVKAVYDLSRTGYPGVLNRIRSVFYSVGGTVNNKTLSASAATTAAFTKSIGKIVAPVVVTTATFAKVVGKSVSSSVTSTPTVKRSVGKTLSAAITQTATLVRSVGKSFSATASTTVSLIKSAGKTLAASVTQTASISAGRAFLRSLSASVTATASMGRGVGKSLAVVLVTAVSIKKGIAKSLAATISLSALVNKGYARTLSAAVTVSATITDVFQAGIGLLQRIVQIFRGGSGDGTGRTGGDDGTGPGGGIG